MRVAIIKSVNGEICLEFTDIDNTLESLYDTLECRYIDMPMVSEAYYQNGIILVIDDEGKLVEKDVVGIIVSEEFTPLDTICGTYLLCSHDGKGETIGLTREQEQFIIDSLRIVTIKGQEYAIIPS